MRKAIGILAIQLLLFGGLVFGQIIVSSIVGTVVDPTGALIPGAQVTITNSDTGISVKATTSSNGTYSVPGLMAGSYEVTIQAAGFNTYHATGIKLVSSTTVRVDAKLSVGKASQAVVVTDNAQLVHTDSMSISGSVSTRQLSDLPTSLQTIDAALKTAPGVMPYGANPDSSNTNPIVGGGSHWGAVNFTLNGMEVNDPFNGGAVTIQSTGGGALVLPPPGSLQELSVKSADMTAQYEGHSTVTLVTKAGTNHFHGEAYEFLQNTALNANTYVSNADGLDRPVDHLNQFGGNVGGPIIRRKAFFFLDINGYRHAYAKVAQLHFPSMAMRQGDFSALCTAPANQAGGAGTFDSNGICSNGKYQLYNPFTGDAFPNNQIPSDMIASQAKTLLTYLPPPTLADDPGNPNEKYFNYVASNSAIANIYGAQLRIDYTLSPKDRLYGVYARRVADPWGLANATYPGSKYGETINSYSERNISGSETHVFNQNTLNDFRVAWGDYATRFSGENLKFSTSSLFPQDPPSLFHGLPTISVSGYTGMFHDYGSGLYTPRKNIEFNDDFTYIHGRHTFQAGIDENGYKIWYRVPSANNVTGLFTSNGNWTGNHGWPAPQYSHSNGNAFADFLIGVGSSSQTSVTGNFATWNYTRYLGVYAQDTWQATPRLTIFYGLRVEHQTPWHQSVIQQTSFDPANNKLVLPEDSSTPTLPSGAQADLFAAYPYETTQALGLSTHFNQPYGKHIAPRFGFAFRPFGNQKTVVRGGVGVYYNFVNAAVSGANEAFNPPWTVGIAQNFSSLLPGSPQSPYYPDITFSDPYPSTNNKTVVSAHPSIHYVPRDFRAGVSTEWNLTVEQQIGTNWAARISYLGSTSSHLPYNGADYNAILQQQPDIPYQTQRPYQPWTTISSFLSEGREEFNQLQLGLRRRFSDGLLFQAEYQYTRSLDDVGTSGGPEIPFDYMSNYGNTDGERRHWVVINYDYELPFGRGRKWLRNSNAFTNAVAGGWQISGITEYGTGVPINLGMSLLGTGIVGWNPFRPQRVSGVPLYAGQKKGHKNLTTEGDQWFNPDAFIPPPCSNSLETTDSTNTNTNSTITCQDVYKAGNDAGVPTYAAYGNAARNMLFGPGYWNWDMSGMKAFTLHESTKLQLRADFIDAFNHTNLSNPNVTLPDVRDGGNPNPNFGLIQSGIGNRTIQLALKLMF